MNSNSRLLLLVIGGGLALSGCGQKSASGSYIASDSRTVDWLQLTESKDGQLLGTLTEVGYKADGSLDRISLNVTGATDGRSITIVAKPDGIAVDSTSISGTIGGGTIVLTSAEGTQKFVEASSDVYQSRINELSQRAATVRIAKVRQHEQEQIASQLRSESNAAEVLASKLERYAEEVNAKHDLGPFHAAHTKLLAAARHDLNIEKALPRGSYAASQADFRISQLSFQLGEADYPYSSFVDQAKVHLQDADEAIRSSPCHSRKDTLAGCKRELQAEAEYAKAKAIVESEMRDVVKTIEQDNAAMQAITNEADDYAH